MFGAAGGAEQVGTTFFGHVDFESSSTYAWRAGTPAMDPSYERLIHEQVDRRLKAKGWVLVEGDADLEVSSNVVRTLSTLVGGLRIDVLEGGSGEIAWRAIATGVRVPERNKNRKMVIRVIKEMFKHFPKAGEP